MRKSINNFLLSVELVISPQNRFLFELELVLLITYRKLVVSDKNGFIEGFKNSMPNLHYALDDSVTFLHLQNMILLMKGFYTLL